VTDETLTPAAPEPPAAPPTPALTLPEPASPRRALSSADAGPRRPDYRGEELDPERGPGLGCFWFQAIVLGFFMVLIPIGVNLAWPYELLAILLFIVIGLLLLTGQTVIFLLRLVAADRRAQGRRRPLASPTKTVGELEDEHRVAHAVGDPRPVAASVAAASPPVDVTADGRADVTADVPDAPAPAEVPDAPGQEAAPAANVPDAPGPEAAPTLDEDTMNGETGNGAPADAGEPPEEPTPGVRQ
jgi:hypothetical protein